MITLQQRSRRLSADLETPISLFLSLTQNKIPGLLLESAEVDGRWGRYSIIACDYLMTVSCVDARLSLSIKDDRLASLKELEGMPYLDGLRSLMQRLELVGDDMRQAPITRALYGYFGYETAALFQPRLAQAIPASSAESCLVLAGTVIVFDHLYNRLTQLSLGEHRDLSHAPLHGAEEPSIGEVSRTPDQAAYMKGVEHIKELRKRENVIIISARNSLEDKVLGLEQGADDYLPKPFHLAELSARIRSVVRRHQRGGQESLDAGNVRLFPDSRRVEIAGREVELLRKEYDILYYFMSRPNHMIDKTTLAEAVWGDHIDQADNFDFVYAQMKNLRRKLHDAGADIEIRAVYGFGYKLVAP